MEEEHRHRFFQVILAALTELQFPPTLEAFSNPLQPLCDEIPFKHEAMKYLLECTTDQTSRRRRFSDRSHGSAASISQPSSAAPSPRLGAPDVPDPSYPSPSPREFPAPQSQRSARPRTPSSSRQPSNVPTPRTPKQSPRIASPSAACTRNSHHEQRQRPTTSAAGAPTYSLGDYEHLRHSLEVRNDRVLYVLVQLVTYTYCY